MVEILQNKLGKKIILLGNEAIVRGALEAGVNFVSTYPGTPASEIGNTFFRIAKEGGPYFEFSTNEKVALEAGIGASFSGLKTLVAMKNFGLNVCLDALIPFVYTGTKGPTVIIVADDPSCHSSAQSEENTRPIEHLVHLPILEPSDPQECLDFTKLAFEISEKFKIPVMIRTTTRVAHQRMPVKLGDYESGIKNKVEFIKDPKRFITLPPRVLEMKKELLEKIEKIREFSEKSKINKTEGNRKSKIGIITSAISYLYVKESLKELNLDLPVLKLGVFYPSPNKKTKNFIKDLKKVLIVEELEASLEEWVKGLAKEVNPKLQIFGKNLLPTVGELKPEYVILAIAKISNKKYKIQNTKYKIPASKRLPQLCPGCPYWLVISAIKKAVDVEKVIFGGEIGCYMLFGNSPINLQDYLSCMGSSVGIAHGIKKAGSAFAPPPLKFRRASKAQARKQKVIAFVGDSSFFHAGIPALINTVFNKSNPLIIILENQTTAMTGHQPHPGAPVIPNGIKIENIVSACGVKNLKVIDPINQEEFTKTVKEFLEKDEVSVIIARRPCIFVAQKYEKKT
ncbi:MAG: indolepyruvate ferredoxin oxidoreductase subunit alpha [Candidatus Nealsonbacteria bacterium CG23_combo_of_CG06-09_8_20_14_all_36_12]|uniref:Indolepyruvate oxidoreductase subunit IorA n=2 Tax=Candidatus Nealsoniibacteriota TaxID=1817911 RepID=A0A2H0TLQ3_9BACT|nr:MAG: indolepyruvate ferredoxin oxidoreductase subunit alpha [Candidatus Nealsonbacteria bacterium CG23_combo_of_CG06-09_8_20_14_all_36_12]PIR73069.1 MAG: indolepyruvate ferredoxin oxidoreductase subunit alpha [Candidatus Nealsonbacteria bacterium CG10_big_fil_rev_8_21_14_0_10_36_23]